jgi:tetratricopeptide (TPR) repeat protein
LGDSHADVVVIWLTFTYVVKDSPESGTIETFFWGSHPKTTERIETIEQEATKYSVVYPMNKDAFDRKTARVRLANANWDAYLGRWALAVTQVNRVVESVPAARRTYVQTLCQADLYRAASIGAMSRKNYQQTEQNFDIAIGQYNQIISMPNTQAKAGGYLGLGELYFAHRNHKTTHCKAMDAYKKYLDLQPTAKNASSIQGRIDELRKTCQ